MTYRNNLKQYFAAVAVLAIAPMTQAFAGGDVRVDAGVKNANVCLGTLSDPAAFGAKKTGLSGEVVFRDVPNGRAQVTVSRSGYKGQSRRINMAGFSSSVYAPVSPGVGGATCILARVELPANSSQKDEQNSHALRLSRMSLNSGSGSTSSRSVKITSSVDGKPTHYRASESSTFEGASWQAYAGTPVFELSAGKGNKTVYFQVKKSVAVGNGSIDRESRTMSDNIKLR
ncbi:MAG: carboxypeptidase regulatory-like domain-containing protein [Methylococcales bacterium]|jgi:hypothetical protein|nr:carboxypeptidase regulatory-like domain-containing protein [Methylococcales bacterium]